LAASRRTILPDYIKHLKTTKKESIYFAATKMTAYILIFIFNQRKTIVFTVHINSPTYHP